MKYDSVVEVLFSVGLFVNAALFVPQIRRIFLNKDAREVSILTFLGFWFILLFTMLHGFVRKDYFLAFGTLLSVIMCGFIIWLIVYYRSKNKSRVG